MLDNDELKKDFDQIKAAAEKIYNNISVINNVGDQNEKIKELLQSKDFSTEMATWLNGAYYRGQNMPDPGMDTAPVAKEVHENVAMNLAGFYAVECGVGYICEKTGQNPKEVLESIKDGNLDEENMLLLARFANATWKAGQPFRDLNRITKPNFIPATMLDNDELKKDFDQIKAAAEKMLQKL
jgi:hypothetical protein